MAVPFVLPKGPYTAPPVNDRSSIDAALGAGGWSSIASSSWPLVTDPSATVNWSSPRDLDPAAARHRGLGGGLQAWSAKRRTAPGASAGSLAPVKWKPQNRRN